MSVASSFSQLDLCNTPTNAPRGFHVETTWKRPFPRCFNVESMWCVCRESFKNYSNEEAIECEQAEVY